VARPTLRGCEPLQAIVLGRPDISDIGLLRPRPARFSPAGERRASDVKR